MIGGAEWWPSSRSWLIGLAALALAFAGCRSGMYDQPRYEPLEPSSFFEDGLSARPVITGTVARGQLHEDEPFYTGMLDGQPIEQIPLEVDEALLTRGQERFNIYCAPCHSQTGDGDGMIVRRGMPRPPSYHSKALREAAAGHFFDVITNGHGVMYSYASRVKPRDRWAIVAYIRALQLSEASRLEDVPATERERLENTPETATDAASPEDAR